jgi:NAD(P)-dependent dehydrogenase (short-subunit alcohol dehydrogenase family)
MKNALVWGAGGAIGAAIAARLQQDGWQVLAAGRRLESLERLGESVFEVDLGDPYSVQAAVTAISQQASEVDLWVYAAGDIASQKVADLSPAAWKRLLDANLNGAFLATHYSWPLLSDAAHLFYLGALSERMRLPGLAAYAAAKAGLEALAEVVRKESRRKVTIVRPGAVDTPFWGKVPFRLPAHPLSPQQVAERIVQAYQEGHSGNLDL